MKDILFQVVNFESPRESNIKTKDAVISGSFKGKMTASGEVEITSSGKFIGNLTQRSGHFSINKGGISTLINFAKGIKDKNISVVMEGLSYNYIRFFEMAGINKIADLVEEKTDE